MERLNLWPPTSTTPFPGRPLLVPVARNTWANSSPMGSNMLCFQGLYLPKCQQPTSYSSVSTPEMGPGTLKGRSHTTRSDTGSNPGLLTLGLMGSHVFGGGDHTGQCSELTPVSELRNHSWLCLCYGIPGLEPRPAKHLPHCAISLHIHVWLC